MTWHCPGWYESVETDVVTEGADADSIYEDYACTEFSSSVNVTINAADEIIDQSETDEAWCSRHERNATWDGYPDVVNDLINYKGFSQCPDCEGLFTTEDFLTEHFEDSGHSNELHEQIFTAAPRPRPRHHTTHAAWS